MWPHCIQNSESLIKLDAGADSPADQGFKLLIKSVASAAPTHLGNDSLGQIHIRATTGEHQAGTNQNHGSAGSGLARIKTVADHHCGWPGSGLVWIMADEDHGWSGSWLAGIMTGSRLAGIMAGWVHGRSGSSLVRIVASRDRNKTETAPGSITPSQKRIWNRFELD